MVRGASPGKAAGIGTLLSWAAPGVSFAEYNLHFWVHINTIIEKCAVISVQVGMGHGLHCTKPGSVAHAIVLYAVPFNAAWRIPRHETAEWSPSPAADVRRLAGPDLAGLVAAPAVHLTAGLRNRAARARVP